MDNMFENIVRWAGAAVGVVVGLLGGWDVGLQVLIAFMVIDYITGLIVAFTGHSKKTENGKLDSGVGLVGILKKFLILLMVVTASCLDRLIDNGTVIRTSAVFFFIANEGLSILENVGLMGIRLPGKLKDALEKLSEGKDRDA